MLRFLFSLLGIFIVSVNILAIDPTETNYNDEQCQGSLMPYPGAKQAYDYPDSLTPVFINHVNRHGSRFPASAANCLAMRKALLQADSIGTITTLGKQMLSLTQFAIERSNGQWGALDSLGVAELRGIASRMYSNYPTVLNNGKIKAISSYAPRCIMSMYSFTHQLSRLNNKIEISASSGRNLSSLLRPFDVDQEYIEFRKDKNAMTPYDEYMRQNVPLEPLYRILGKDYPYNEIDAQALALTQYYVIAGMSAMQVQCNANDFFTAGEYNKLWSCFNLRQYLQRTASTVSTIPADIASPLLLDLITSTDDFIDGKNDFNAILRFGHAETLMPLLSLMRLDGCYYMTNYFDTVAQNWKDFDVVPMAANLQIILFRSDSGKYYIRVDRNETPTTLHPNRNDIYIPWESARDYLMRCIPIYYQP